MSGFFLMHRGWMDSFKPEPFTEREAFIWSIEQAAFDAHEQWFNGHRIMVDRGEFATSLAVMSKAFGWSLKKTRGFMDRMRTCEKWAQRRAYDGAQSPTIITVLNYTKYQDPSEIKGTVKGRAKGTRGAQSGHSEGTQQNKGNKGNKSHSPSDSSNGEPLDPMPSAASSLTADDIGEAFDAYSRLRTEFVHGSRPVQPSADRRAKMSARFAEIGGVEGWAAVIGKIRASPFLRGETDRFAFAAIDWLLKPANLRKVLEGNYDERPTRPGAPRGAGGAPRSPASSIFTARDRLFGDRSRPDPDL